jgi:esterase
LSVPRLHYTLMPGGGPSGPSAAPSDGRRSWLVILHGFFGAGRNWTTVARGLAAARPDWGAVLVDLPLHGASQGFPPPHTVESCAAEVRHLAGSLAASQRPAGAVRALLGHSFGGKVALALLAHPPASLRQVWLIDADPSAGAPGGSAWEMLRIVRALPDAFASRGELAGSLERAGLDRRTAEWMATNLEPAEGGGYRWRLDFAALDALLRDYFTRDLWPAVEQVPPDVRLHVVTGTRSDAVPPSAAVRFETIARTTGRVALHSVEGGHWLNTDNPADLTALLAAALPRG